VLDAPMKKRSRRGLPEAPRLHIGTWVEAIATRGARFPGSDQRATASWNRMESRHMALLTWLQRRVQFS
jgi:hypothetical protein